MANNRTKRRSAALRILQSLAALLVLCLAGSIELQAQESQSGTISGTVVDDLGESCIGVSVVVVGEGDIQGTVTDFDGRFTIKKVPAGAKLRFSYVGFATREETATDGMTVQLKPENVQLQGVEVVAYGKQKKVTVTGAISSVKGEELTHTPVGNVTDVLAGMITGVSTVQATGEPGSNSTSIFVRGKSTFADGGTSPLIQVDGVEREMYDIDPEDIESITVLKDASATAVFGIRGANGVILITTKRGKEGKAKINVSTSFSALTPSKMLEQASSYEYATFYNQMLANDGQTEAFTEEVLEHFKTGDSPVLYPSTQWTDYMMKNLTLQSKHNINISGGTKKVRYFVSAGFYTEGGLFKQFNQSYDNSYKYHRFNYRSNLDIDVTRTTTISFNIAGVVDNAHKPYTGQGSSGMIKTMVQATPFSSPGLVDGKMVYTTTDYGLPFTGGSGTAYYGSGFMQTSNNTMQTDLQVEQKLDFITNGLSLKLKGSYNSNFLVYKRGKASIASYTPVEQEEGSVAYKKEGQDVEPEYVVSSGKSRNWYIEGNISWARNFGLHHITALALYNQSKTYYPSQYSGIPHGYVGLVGRATYDYANRYMAEFNIGYNGSENYAEDLRFGTFPAFSAGWNISEEKFWEPIKQVVSYLKIRGSWGLVGKDNFSTDRFYYTSDPYYVNQGGLMAGGGGYGYNFGINNKTVTKSTVQGAKHNYNVTWEKAFKQDYGIDIVMVGDQLSASFDYYRENRKDIMLNDYSAPVIIGFTTPVANLGEVKSWGWEASVKWNSKIKDFRYWAGVNLSYNQNEIIEMKEEPQSYDYMYQKGHRIGARSMYKFWKFYYEGCEADYEKEFGQAFPTQLATLKEGDCVFVDLNGDGVIDSNDKTRDLGYTDDPEYVIGLNLGFSWKGLSMNMQWTGAWNVTRMLSDVFRRPFVSATSTTDGGLLKYHVDHTWNTANPGQDYEYPRATWENGENNYADCTLYEKDAKYLRLKTLQLSYDFQLPFMKKLGLTTMQLALSGYNLLTFTPYIWGDPETRASNAPSYPLQKTYTVSLKLGF